MPRNVRRLIGLDRARIRDLAFAAVELGLARLRLKSHSTRAVISEKPADPVALDNGQVALVDRVAFAIPRVASRLPWRSDCLVQALAAKHWLGRYGITSTIIMGVPQQKSAEFEAHAWLKASGKLVTGGDVSRHNPLV